MATIERASLAAGLLMALWTPNGARAAVQEVGGSGAVARALRHVPPPVATVVVVDPELAPDREALRQLDAFVVRERDGTLRQVVYVNARSPLVQAAAGGSSTHVALLAAVIHHEMQHLGGASETEARRAERDLFARLTERGVVARADGVRHLRQLESRPPPTDDRTGHAPGGPPP